MTMALTGIRRLVVVTVFCVFGTTGFISRKQPATFVTIPPTTDRARLTSVLPLGTSTGATTNTTTERPDGLLNKYNITAAASASASASASALALASASASAALLTHPPPLRQPVPEPLTVSEPTPEPSGNTSVSNQTDPLYPQQSSGHHVETPQRLTTTGGAGQNTVSGQPGATATTSLTSTSQTQSVTLQAQPAPSQLPMGQPIEAAARSSLHQATRTSPAVTVIPYPCDGYNCPADKPHCVLVRQQCKAFRCPAVPTCSAVPPLTVQCLIGHPVYDDIFNPSTCGPRGDYNCPTHSDCDETSGFATCCWTGRHGAYPATSKLEPTSYLLSAPNPGAQKSGECPRSFQQSPCINACNNDSICAGLQKCCSNGCGTTCVDPVASAQEVAGACPVLGKGDSCPSSTSCNSDSQCSSGSQCCFLSRTCRVCVNIVVGGSHASGKELFPSNDQRFKVVNSKGANSIHSNHVNEANAAYNILRAPFPGGTYMGQASNHQNNVVLNAGVSSQGSVGITGSTIDTVSGVSSKAPQGLNTGPVEPTNVQGGNIPVSNLGTVVPPQQSGPGVGDLGRIQPGDIIVDILNHGANGSHAVISGVTKGGIVHLGRHRIGRVGGSAGGNGTAASQDALHPQNNLGTSTEINPQTLLGNVIGNVIGNGPNNPVKTNMDTIAVGNFAESISGAPLGGNVGHTPPTPTSVTNHLSRSVADSNAYINAGGTGPSFSNLDAAAGTGRSLAANSASSATLNIGSDVTAAASRSATANVAGTGNTGGATNGTSGSTILAQGASSQSSVIDRATPVPLDTVINAQESGNINLNNVNSGSSGNVIGDITFEGTINASNTSVAISNPTLPPTLDAGPLGTSYTLSDPSVSSGGTGTTGFVGDIVSGAAVSGGSAEHNVGLSSNIGGVSSKSVGTVIDASGNNGIGILNGQIVNPGGNSGMLLIGNALPGISNVDTRLSPNVFETITSGTIVVDQGITGNGNAVSIGTGDLGNIVSATSQSAILPNGIPDQQGRLSQSVLDSPLAVTDVLGSNGLVEANAIGGVNGGSAVGSLGIDNIHSGVLGTPTYQQGGSGNSLIGTQTGGTGANGLAGNGALSGAISGTTGAISEPGFSGPPSNVAQLGAIGTGVGPTGSHGNNPNNHMSVVGMGAVSDARATASSAGVSGNANARVSSGKARAKGLQNINTGTVGGSGSLLSNGITPSPSGSSGLFQTDRRGSLRQSHPRQPRFHVQIETTHFGPHSESGVSNVGGASARSKHTSTSVKIENGPKHFSTSVNIGRGVHSRQEVKINHHVADTDRNGRNMGMAGNPRLQTSINIGSSPDVRPKIRKTVSMNAPRSQNLRQRLPVNRHTSHLPPSNLAPGSRNSLRSSAARSATITRSDPFVHPGTSSLSRSTIAGSTASRAIAAGNVVVNGPAPGIRRVAGNSGISRNNGLHLNTGASSSVPGRFGTAASGIQDLGLNAGEYSSAAGGRYPVHSGSRGSLGPSTRNHGAALADVQGTIQSRSGVRGTLKGLRGASQVPLSGLLSGFDFGQFPSVTNPQGNSALGVSQTAPATSNVPSSSPMQNGGSELAGALKPSAFPLPTSYDVSATKPGICLKPCGFSLCINECNHDSQCPGSKKCCSSGCGRVCSEPYPYIPTIKPGVCPASRSSAVCTRRHSCSHDGECPGSSKCCCVGSGCRVCVQQVISLPKMATVPFLPQRTLSQFPMIGKGYVWR